MNLKEMKLSLSNNYESKKRDLVELASTRIKEAMDQAFAEITSLQKLEIREKGTVCIHIGVCLTDEAQEGVNFGRVHVDFLKEFRDIPIVDIPTDVSVSANGVIKGSTDPIRDSITGNAVSVDEIVQETAEAFFEGCRVRTTSAALLPLEDTFLYDIHARV